MTAANAPAVFHITHHKAGSQWIKSILHDAAPAPGMFVPAQRQVAHVLDQPLQTGKIYPTVYLTRQRFEALDLPAPHRRFVVIRDLRDTLVSLYFGLKVHHHLFREDQRRVRTLLNKRDVEAGLIFLINERLQKSADIQRSWIGAMHGKSSEGAQFPLPLREGAGGWVGRTSRDEPAELILRYEDLLREPFEHFARIMAHCEFNIEPERLRELVEARNFRNVAKRLPGEENIRSHQRKGIAGDWRAHFSDRVKDAFKQRYAQLLIDTGYERTPEW
jgi:hypothetical protein